MRSTESTMRRSLSRLVYQRSSHFVRGRAKGFLGVGVRERGKVVCFVLLVGNCLLVLLILVVLFESSDEAVLDFLGLLGLLRADGDEHGRSDLRRQRTSASSKRITKNRSEIHPATKAADDPKSSHPSRTILVLVGAGAT